MQHLIEKLCIDSLTSHPWRPRKWNTLNWIFLWLFLNIMVDLSQLELEFRIIWELGITHPHARVCVCARVHARVLGVRQGALPLFYIILSWIGICFGIVLQPLSRGKAFRRLTVVSGIRIHPCSLLRPRTSKDTKHRFPLCRLLYFLTEFSQWLKALAKALSTCSLSTVLDANNSLSDSWRSRPSLFWSL